MHTSSHASLSSPPSPLSYDSFTPPYRRSSICLTDDSSALLESIVHVPHRRTRSFRDNGSKAVGLQRYTTFELDSNSTARVAPSPVLSNVTRKRRAKPPPLQCVGGSGNNSSACSSASTNTTVFFNSSTESTNRSVVTKSKNVPGSPNGSNWSVGSEYSTTSTNKGFPKGKLAYLASRRGSSGSVCSSTTNTPPNTPGYVRFGHSAARRQSSGNFLEVPLPSPSLQQSPELTNPPSSPQSPITPTNPRNRVNSLPASSLFCNVSHLSPTSYYATPNPRNEDYLYRLRTFNITKQGGVVNCGDTFVRKSKSNNCISENNPVPASPTRSQRSSPCRRGSLSPRLVVSERGVGSCCVSRDESEGEDEEDELLENHGSSAAAAMPESPVNKRYRVVLLGESGVGKSALVRQFMTSEYINTYDMSLDEEYGEREVSILLDSKESSLVFVDHPASEMAVENSLATYEPHACVVVYSITDKHSFEFASEILRYLWHERSTTVKRSVILVGNKCDLARVRVISTHEGKSLATCYECKFIETSSGIQHNVDELLVGVLKQIRLREAANDGGGSVPAAAQLVHQASESGSRQKERRGQRGSIMSVLFTRELINKLCFLTTKNSRSCENLHIL